MNNVFAEIADDMSEICRKIDLIRGKHLRVVHSQYGDALLAQRINPATVRERQAKMRMVS